MSIVIDLSNLIFTQRDVEEARNTTDGDRVVRLNVAALEARPRIEEELYAFWREQETQEEDDRIYEIFRDFLFAQLAEQDTSIREVTAYIFSPHKSIRESTLQEVVAIESTARRYVAQKYADDSGRYWFDAQ
ncbi:MAG: hypothetical protein EOP09_15460 [Proteobacteria bacterium]|nr:MAG: hypothetical protein EOP09_15460 [Pseudomonadota bacterium]